MQGDMAEKNRFLSWLKLWHPSKKSTTGDSVEGSSHSQHKFHHGDQRARQVLLMYGRRGWIPRWNLLHHDRKACTETKEVHMESPHRNRDHRFGPAFLEGKADHATHRRLQTSLMNLHEKVTESTNLKVNVRRMEVSKRAGASMDVDVVGVDLQVHKSGLKNRVLPVTAPVDVRSSLTPKSRASTLFSVDEEGPGMESAKRAEPKTPKLIGSLSFKKMNFARILSTPVSPKSPSETKWRKLLSCSSQAGSPRSPMYFHQAEWSSPYAECSRQKGSVSTVGSPWHSQAGGHKLHSHRTASKGSYKQGEWITTDSDFVVLEL